MCPTNEHLQPTRQVETAVARLREAWERSQHPNIADYLPDEQGVRALVLAALVELDLRKRYAVGESPRIEDYLPLANSVAGEMQLIAVDFGVRSTRESNLSIEQYTDRFPQFADELPSLLQSGSQATRGRS